MKKKRRQLLAIICVLAMVCTMLPASEDMRVEAATSETGRQVITHCDSTDGITFGNQNTQCVSHSDYVKEGNAFYINTTSQSVFEMTFAQVTDISKYGTIHLSLKIVNLAAWNGLLRINVSSNQNPDTQCVKWTIDKSTLVEGWNELDLVISKAGYVASDFDSTSLNYIKIWQGGGNASDAMAVSLDEVYAYNESKVTVKKYTSGTITGGVAPDENDYDSTSFVFGGWFKNYDATAEKDKQFTNPLSEGEEVTATTDNPVYAKLVPKDVLSTKAQYVRDGKDKKVITDCNSTENIALNNGAQCTTDEEYAKEGGSFYINTQAQTLFEMKFQNAIDISKYETIHLSLFVQNPTYWNGLVRINISSTQNPDAQCVKWTIDSATLEEGWNELNLNLTEYGQRVDFDSTKLNYIKIWQGGGNASSNLVVAVDDIYAERELSKRTISDCDTAAGTTPLSWSNATLNTDATYIKEGAGSLKASGGYLKFALTNAVDITEYQNGSLHFWLYTDNLSNMGTSGITISLASSGTHDTQRLSWTYIGRAKLQVGWNELYLPLSDCNNASTGDGNVFDPTNVNCFCIEGLGTANVYLDDVSVVDGVYLLTGVEDNVDIVASNSIGTTFTITEDEYLCGSGAYKNANSAMQVRHAAQTKLLTGDTNYTYNIATKYQTNGALHFWLYINDIDAWNGDMTVQLSSDASTPDSNHLQWTVSKEHLKEGWNEFYLNLSQAAKTGSVDFTKINYFRVMMAGDSTTNISTILDDVCIIANDAETADVRFVSTVDTLQYREVKIKIEKAGSTSFVCEPTKTVYSQLYAVGSDSNIWEEFPTLFHSESGYFFAQTITNMPIRVFDSVFTATPYWTTLDGTEVQGTSRTYTINQAISTTID